MLLIPSKWCASAILKAIKFRGNGKNSQINFGEMAVFGVLNLWESMYVSLSLEKVLPYTNIRSKKCINS